MVIQGLILLVKSNYLIKYLSLRACCISLLNHFTLYSELFRIITRTSNLEIRLDYMNSVLWFLYNRMDCMKADILIKAVAHFYTDKDVKDAKNELFKHFPDVRNVKRAGDGKREVNIKDILERLHCITEDNDKSLKFVIETCHFPSLNLKDIDTYSMMEEFYALKKEVLQLKNDSSSEKNISEQIAKLRCMVSELSALYKKEARKRRNDVTAQKIDLTGGENPPLDKGDEMHAEEQTSGTKSYADIMKQTNSSNSSENL